MWIVCKIGFFNIVQYPSDKEENLLTIKARSAEDLINLEAFIPFSHEIEKSDEADYKFRRKANKRDVGGGFQSLIREIDYAKTKPAIIDHFPMRAPIYFNVWNDLCEIEDLNET